MEWYVLNYDFNRKKLYDFNIFNSTKFTEGVKEAIKEWRNSEDKNFLDFVERINRIAQYSFWSKREYELFIGDAFEQDINKYTKVDVYAQLKPNIKILAEYILSRV